MPWPPEAYGPFMIDAEHLEFHRVKAGLAHQGQDVGERGDVLEELSEVL